MEFKWEISKSERRTPLKTLVGIGVVSLLSAVYFFIIQSYFASVLFIVAPVVIVFISLQAPDKFLGKVTSRGVRINNKNYDYDSLEHFSIIQDSLILKIKEGSAQYFPIHQEDADELREALINYIPEKEHEETLVEVISRFLGLH